MNQDFIEAKKKRFLSGLSVIFIAIIAASFLFSNLGWKWPFIISMFIIGVVLLIEGADWVVHAASHLARSLGIPPVIIGLLFIAFLTSVPELAVTLYAVWSGEPDIAVGNLVGSNIANIGLIIGLCAMFSPIVVQSFTVLLETPFLLLSSVVFFILSFRLFDLGSSNYVIGKIDGVILLLFFIMFLVYTWKQAAIKEPKKVQEEFEKEFGTKIFHHFRTLFVFLVGFIAVFLGAKFVVGSGTEIARGFGVSEAIIGLTLVAVGTSLPELMVSIVGLLKKEYDLVAGNIVGSNVLNLLFIGGIAALWKPIVVDTHLLFVDMIVLILFGVFFQIFITTNKTISRKEGAVLFFLYVIYFGYLVWYGMS